MKKKILIVGDSPLVEEYSALCIARGYSITARATKSDAPALELTNLSPEQKRKNLRWLETIVAKNTTIISSSTTITVEEQAGWLKHPDRLIGIGALPTLLNGNLVEFAASSRTSVATKNTVEEFAKSLGKDSVFVADSPGLVMPRILCALANESFFAMMESVADESSIDTAMMLGTNYPHGPVAWAEAIGLKHVLAVLDALHAHFREDRYRAAPLIRQRAMAGYYSSM